MIRAISLFLTGAIDMYKKPIHNYLFTMMLLLSGAAIGGDMVLAPPGFIAQTVTRDVAEYTAQEQALMAAVIAKENQPKLLLADDFEVWTGQGSDWQSKSEWLKTIQQQSNFTIRNLSVRLMDDFAVVSFSLETVQGRHNKHSTQFIVDLWRKSTNKLTVRYVSDLSPSSSSSLSRQDRKI